MYAAASPSRRSAKLLIQAGADIDARSEGGVTALMIAGGGGRRVVMNVLLAHGASIDKAAEDISCLVPPGILPDEAAALHNLLPQEAEGVTALWLAAFAGHVETAAQLLGAGADAELAASSPDLSGDDEGEPLFTALEAAERRRHRSAARLIRDYPSRSGRDGGSSAGRR